jgi:hypothetical protein
MDFEVSAISQLRPAETAHLTLSASPERGQFIGSTAELGASQRMKFVFPDDESLVKERWRFTLRAEFRNEERGSAEASVLVYPSLIRGLHVVQLDTDYIVANIQHRERAGHFENDQCTVVCPRTGESRSGRNVCIECTTKRGTIKICC